MQYASKVHTSYTYRGLLQLTFAVDCVGCCVRHCYDEQQQNGDQTTAKQQGDITVGRLEQWALTSMPALAGADFVQAELPEDLHLPELPLV